MSAQHTPGPWSITAVMTGHKGDVYARTAGAKLVTECHHIARCFAPKPEKDPACTLQVMQQSREAIAQIEANARLIAAAPELLRALEAFRNHLSGTPNPSAVLVLLAEADIVIAKARGEA